MFRIYLQNGLVVGKETMHHINNFEGLEGIFVDDSVVGNTSLPAMPVYDGEILTGIQELEYIPYTIDKNPITTIETATITTVADVIVIVDGVEYPPEADGIISYSNANTGAYEITLKKHGYKNTIVMVEVVAGA